MRDLVIPPAVMKEAAKNATAAAALLSDIKRMLRAPASLTPQEQRVFIDALSAAGDLLRKAQAGIWDVQERYWEQQEAERAKATAVKSASTSNGDLPL